mmetsp:Transcript_14524/g.16242  ORF Transcript_14524/g.16242 Transcript_14524/m.16242 type:complete len:92 (+) Transcript_14524:37-312(+)|eukprot:CAMPEP_0205818380 /NCGR_PEP_ID=MMETSP0206-20130828/285_1 /ASSEMBLY_ACC=CAM_ASM_000279 /TAXON_ID=36767 /ORGANISM="Euplotes focardii, Strain TN1" /LENGTH=91 /DNA_ID=CAMNT_0053110705 /DNA_START=37 /DNA_END=312 /DNA_ORIENTATION=+
MPRNNKSKSQTKATSREVEYSKFGGTTLQDLIDQSQVDVSHHTILESKDMEIWNMIEKPHFKDHASNQKKQFGMKRGLNNMRQNFKHNPLM